MLLDKYLGEYQFSERHAIEINAPAFQIIAAAAAYDPRQDPFFRRMIALRELPSRLLQRQTAAPPFGLQNFSQLERNEQELVYGLIGRFWLAKGSFCAICRASRSASSNAGPSLRREMAPCRRASSAPTILPVSSQSSAI